VSVVNLHLSGAGLTVNRRRIVVPVGLEVTEELVVIDVNTGCRNLDAGDNTTSFRYRSLRFLLLRKYVVGYGSDVLTKSREELL